VSKLAYFFLTFVGAVPAAGALYALIMNLLDRADQLGTVLLAVTVTAALCASMIVLTPFIVLVFYKDTHPQQGPAPEPDSESPAGSAAPAALADEDESFGDAIPEDFDEEELAAAGEDDFEDFDDEYGEFDDMDYDDGEFDEFDEEENIS